MKFLSFSICFSVSLLSCLIADSLTKHDHLGINRTIPVEWSSGQTPPRKCWKGDLFFEAKYGDVYRCNETGKWVIEK